MTFYSSSSDIIGVIICQGLVSQVYLTASYPSPIWGLRQPSTYIKSMDPGTKDLKHLLDTFLNQQWDMSLGNQRDYNIII